MKNKLLQNMLDNMINGKAEQAQVNFHEYLKEKNGKRCWVERERW